MQFLIGMAMAGDDLRPISLLPRQRNSVLIISSVRIPWRRVAWYGAAFTQSFVGVY